MVSFCFCCNDFIRVLAISIFRRKSLHIRVKYVVKFNIRNLRYNLFVLVCSITLYIHTTYIYTYIDTYIHTYTHIYLHTYIHKYIYRYSGIFRGRAIRQWPPTFGSWQIFLTLFSHGILIECKHLKFFTGSLNFAFTGCKMYRNISAYSKRGGQKVRYSTLTGKLWFFYGSVISKQTTHTYTTPRICTRSTESPKSTHPGGRLP